MSAVLDELHDLISDLEAEGHHIAGRLRDVADRIKADVEHLADHGKEELDALVGVLVKALAPELNTTARAFLTKALDAVEPALESAAADAKTVLADVVSALRGLLAAA